MDILRRELAPISPEGWSLIDTTAKDTLSAKLSGRKFVNIDGPHGIAHAAAPLGRLKVIKDTSGKDLGYGVHSVLPLVETRVHFDLPIWELDNLARGAKDINLDSVIEACSTAAAFEEAAVFDGLEPAGIAGLHQAVAGHTVPLTLAADALIDAVREAQMQLIAAGVTGSLYLVANAAICKFLAHAIPGGVLHDIVEKQIGGSVIFSSSVKDALLVAGRGGDAELTVGQDFAIGYHGHNVTTVNLFLAESFTFRVVTPEALVGFVLS
jgi:uncharacterized linocin/CFP29 family protein